MLDYNILRRKYEDQPLAWMDLNQEIAEQKGSKVGIRNVKSSRTSGDGASIEALDSHVTALKMDADSDKKFLEDEMEYLKTLQQINIKTVSKYNYWVDAYIYFNNIYIQVFITALTRQICFVAFATHQLLLLGHVYSE